MKNIIMPIAKSMAAPARANATNRRGRRVVWYA